MNTNTEEEDWRHDALAPINPNHPLSLLSNYTDLTCLSRRLAVLGRVAPITTSRTAHVTNSNELKRQLSRLPADLTKHLMLFYLGPPEEKAMVEEVFFPGTVAGVCPFPTDRHCLLPLKRLFKISQAMGGWLALHPDNVCVLQCTNGITRSGLAIACMLRFHSVFTDCIDAMHWFLNSRHCSPEDRKAILNEQIKRYLRYFDDTCSLNGRVPSRTPMRLHQMVIHTVPNFDGDGGCSPAVSVYRNARLIFDSQRQPAPPGFRCYIDNSYIIFWFDKLILYQDILIRVTHSTATTSTTIFTHAYNTGYLLPGIVRMTANDLYIPLRLTPPLGHPNRSRFDKRFLVDMMLAEVDNTVYAEHAVRYKDAERRGVAQGLRSLANATRPRPQYSDSESDSDDLYPLPKPPPQESLREVANNLNPKNPGNAQKFINDASRQPKIARALEQQAKDERSSSESDSDYTPFFRGMVPSESDEQGRRESQPKQRPSIDRGQSPMPGVFADASSDEEATKIPRKHSISPVDRDRAGDKAGGPGSLESGLPDEFGDERKGPNRGAGRGPGEGPRGKGLGEGKGRGMGPGDGTESDGELGRRDAGMQGAGAEGKGLGKGMGPGEGPGLGKGEGPGEGEGKGPDEGGDKGLYEENGQGLGEAPGQGKGPKGYGVNSPDFQMDAERSAEEPLGEQQPDMESPVKPPMQRPQPTRPPAMQEPFESDRPVDNIPAQPYRHPEPAAQEPDLPAPQPQMPIPRSAAPPRAQPPPQMEPEAEEESPEDLQLPIPRPKKKASEKKVLSEEDEEEEEEEEEITRIRKPRQKTTEDPEEEEEVEEKIAAPPKRESPPAVGQVPSTSIPPSIPAQVSPPPSIKLEEPPKPKPSPPPPPPPPPQPSPAPQPVDDPNRVKSKHGLHWSDIKDKKDLAGTMWADMEGSEDLDVHKFEDLFCVDPKNEKRRFARLAEGAPGSPALSSAPTFIDIRRANNIGIGTSRFYKRFNNDEIKQKIVSHSNDFSLDDLYALKEIMPTPKEQAFFSEYDGPREALVPAEQFLQDMTKEPGIAWMTESMLLEKAFEADLKHCTEKIDTTAKVLDKLVESKGLKKVLKTTLDLGNLTNYDYGRAIVRNKAHGFRVDTLPNLKDVWAVDRESNLTHYLSMLTQKKDPEALQLHRDFPELKKARNFELKAFLKTVDSLRNQVDIVRNARGAPATLQSFHASMQPFLSTADRLLADADRTINSYQSSWNRALNYFGEKEANIKPEEMFGYFEAFMSDLDTATRQLKEKKVKIAKTPVGLRASSSLSSLTDSV